MRIIQRKSKIGMFIWIPMLLVFICFLAFVTVKAADSAIHLTATSDASQNCINLNWTAPDTQSDYTYMIYQARGDKAVSSSDYQTIPANNHVKVLQIYPQTPQLVGWVNAYGQGKITCDSVAIESFNANPDVIWNYDVIVFGFWNNNNYKDITSASVNVVKNYISKGYGVLFGHDTLIPGTTRNFNSLASYCNITVDNRTGDYPIDKGGVTNITIARKGLLTNYPYQIGDVGTTLTIPYAHATNQYALGDIWMYFSESVDPLMRTYLTTWNNCALIQTGHSDGAATPDEQRLLMNTLFYLAQRTKSTNWSDHMGQDLTAPEKPKLLSANFDIEKKGIELNVSSQDKGDTYQYYVEATDSNTGEKITSNTVSANLQTGLKGYSIVLDQKADTIPDNMIESATNTYLIPFHDKIDLEKPYYIHVKAIDNAGNASETLHRTYVTLNAQANPDNNCIDLNWCSPDANGNYTYMLYQTQGEETVAKSCFHSIPANDHVKVLQIYPAIPQLVDWVKAYGQGKITCDAVTIEAFNSNPSIIWNYDVIVFGFWDGNNGFKDISVSAVPVLKQYIEKGYGVLFGHDTLKSYCSCNFNQFASYCNLKIAPISSSYERYSSNGAQITISKKGLLTNYPYQIGDIGTVLTIPYAHSVGQQALGDIWMTFNNQVNPLYKAYLSTWNNCAMIQTGHSNGSATPDEQRLLMNTLYYLCQRTTNTSWSDHMGQDLAGPTLPILNSVQSEPSNRGIILDMSSIDKADTYQYYVEATNADTGEKITSNIVTAALQTGLAGYSVVVDQNPDTIPDNSVETRTNLCFASLGDDLELEKPVYVHIKAIDKAGNPSETLHTTYEYIEPKSDFEGDLESLLDYAPKVQIKLAVGMTKLDTTNIQKDILDKLNQKNMDTSSFKFEVITYTGKDEFMKLIAPEEWEEGAIRFVINLTDDEDFYSNTEFLTQLSETIKQESIFYVGWGNSLVWQKITALVSSMGKKGAYVYNGNYTRAIDCIVNFIIWNVTFPEGSGTSSDPYILRHGGQLKSMKYKLYGYFELGEHVDFGGVYFEGIGTRETPFTGHFDGKGFTIGNYYQSSEVNVDYVGFFRFLFNATVTNVVLSDITIQGESYIGGLAGYAYGSETIIQNCEVQEVTIHGKTYVGGLIGMMEEGAMYDCSSLASVYGQIHVGGVIGYATGTIIKNVFTAATVTGESCVGGILGTSKWNRIETCESLANLVGNNKVGGIIGYHDGTKPEGYLFDPIILECQSIATVKGQQYVGGILGYGEHASLEKCYAAGTLEGETDLGGITAAGEENTERGCTDMVNIMPAQMEESK